MASTTFTISCTTTIFPSKITSSSLYCNVNPNPRRQSKLVPRAAAASSPSPNNQNPAPTPEAATTVDRRNVLLGLGGLYGAFNLSTYNNNSAVASPVPAPNLSSCGPATISFSTDPVPYSCCPPDYSGDILDYKLPSFSRLNVRPAAHAMQEEQIEKYKMAVQRMKDLPDNDPRSFKQQANVHCAYCNGAYKLAATDDALQVHSSWLFFPFHRWYLYFHERILQSLIGDPTFTIPYWNWDNPRGMYLPEMFDESSQSPLYDRRRNQDHRNGFLLDLGYNGTDGEVASDTQIVLNNLAIMYKQMVSNATSPMPFFGGALRAEGYDKGSSSSGTIESIPHTAVHVWVGDTKDHHEDMGNFYSAGLDPVFYCHHSNVDRMWAIWKTLGGKRRDLTDPDWLQSEFLFFDENKNLVKVKVQDCLDHEKLGYTFQRMPMPWLDCRPMTRRTKQGKNNKRRNVIPPARDVLPTALARNITFRVERPQTGRSTSEKGEQEEVLELAFTFDMTNFIRFDVFVDEDNNLKAFELDRAEYVGGFANLAHVHEHPGRHNDEKSGILTLALTEVLEDLGLEFDRSITVTLVPKSNGDVVTVKTAEVKLVTGHDYVRV